MKNEILKIAIIGAGRVAQHYKKMFDSSAVSGFKETQGLLTNMMDAWTASMKS